MKKSVHIFSAHYGQTVVDGDRAQLEDFMGTRILNVFKAKRLVAQFNYGMVYGYLIVSEPKPVAKA